jgi:hypothetical protein
MSYNLHQHPRKEEQISILLAGAAVLFVWVFGMSTWAVAQKAAPPTTPALRQCDMSESHSADYYFFRANAPSASDSKTFSSGPGSPNAQLKRTK